MAKKTSKPAAAKASKPAARKRKPAASKARRERTYRVKLSCYFKEIGKPGEIIEVNEVDLRQLLDGRGAVLVRDDEPGSKRAKPEPAEVDDVPGDDDAAGEDDAGEDQGEDDTPGDDVDTSGLA